jgi:ubiquinone/menaquinone biosynthesis C-methylase UbiE
VDISSALSSLNEAKQKARLTYNTASDFFDAPALGFWDRYGRGTVANLGLREGARVLDVACGTGASAIPAALAAGASGQVVGVDLAERMLDLARAKAEALGLRNIEFRQADMTSLGYPDASFDAVVCVFGIFFVPDMEGLTAELWRMVRPGGKLAITTWGPGFLAPTYSVWKEEVRRRRPDLDSAFNPWDRITAPETVRKLFSGAGIHDVRVVPEEGRQPIDTPEDFWTMALGTGLRWTIEQLGPETAREVRQSLCTWIAENAVRYAETNVIYATALRA